MNIELILENRTDNSTRPLRFAMDRQLVFGRGPDSAVPLDGSALSRDHFALRASNGSVHLEDLSSNGTWLNGQRLGRGASLPVTPGSAIEIAGYRFEVKSIGDPAATPVQAAATSPSLPAAVIPPPPAGSPLDMVLKPIGQFWDGFTGLEKFMLYVAAGAAALLYAYLQSN